MTGTTWASLRNLLIDRYGHLRARLTRQFGSDDLASESLHETWLRLHNQGDLGQIRHPLAFVMRIAENIARDRLRVERRRIHQADINDALEIADVKPGPEQEARARQEFEMAKRAISELPVRTQSILMASRLDGLSHQMIADRMGISRRTVLYELKRAIEHLDANIERFDESSS